MADIEDWFTLGPPCMNCGERVSNCEVLFGQPGQVVFKGMCLSKTCIKLPPGGNPFMYMVS
ncbi:MAG TPA: hypothetical protein EYN67_17655 [Flavobacteriales bacterium]|nr:hypothetical protein [Flavobacteriales bacterium]